MKPFHILKLFLSLVVVVILVSVFIGFIFYTYSMVTGRSSACGRNPNVEFSPFSSDCDSIGYKNFEIDFNHWSERICSMNENVELNNFGEEKYKCKGTCVCVYPSSEIGQHNRRNSRTSKSISKGISVVLSSVSSLLALDFAKKYFEDECSSTFSDDECQSFESISSEVDGCEIEKKSTFVEKESSSSFGDDDDNDKKSSDTGPFPLLKKRIVGLTGGICSGKSTCAKHLAQKGYKVIDADKYGHKAYEPGTGFHEKVVETFGKQILNPDQTINREELGKIVFGSKKEMKKLTDLAWPEIRRLIREDIESCKDEVVIVEATLLVESGWNIYTEIWVLDCPSEVQIERVMKRNGISRAQAEKILKSQMMNDDRLKHADYVIKSDSPMENMLEQTLDCVERDKNEK